MHIAEAEPSVRGGSIVRSRTLVIRRLADVGYDGALSVELKDHHSRATPELQREGLLRSKGFIEQFLREK